MWIPDYTIRPKLLRIIREIGSLAARKKDFARLVASGLIRSVGGGRSTHYVLNEEDDA